MSIVIVGGGIIGVSTAYFLAKCGVKVTVIEQESIACAASGKAGGFLARDWCSHYEMDVLAREGFALHMELAQELGEACDYRQVDTYSINVSDKKKSSRSSSTEYPTWIGGQVSHFSRLGDTSNTAQVHPHKLTNLLFQKAQEITGGATQLKLAQVTGLEFSASKLIGVRIGQDEEEELVSADIVLLAMGPWVGYGLKWLPAPCHQLGGFSGHRAHGIVVRPSGGTIDATCLFTEFRGATYGCSPEVYPRPDGTVYVCGLSDGKALPPSPAQVETEQWRCDRLREVVAHLSPQSLAGGAVVESHACYLPISPDGIPAIGVVPGVTGVYMATGNSCWGILTGPITGRFLAAMIVRDHHADLLAGHVQPEQEELAAGRKLLNDPRFREFDPARFVVAETTNPGSTIRVTKKPSS